MSERVDYATYLRGCDGIKDATDNNYRVCFENIRWELANVAEFNSAELVAAAAVRRVVRLEQAIRDHVYRMRFVDGLRDDQLVGLEEALHGD